MSVLKSLHQRGQHNWIKILCLATGLATGIVLIGKAGFEQSWDNFFPTSDRIYVVYEDVIRNGEYIHYSHRAQPLDNQGYLCLPASSLTVGATGVASMNSIKHDDG